MLNLNRWVVIKIITGYQYFISPYFPPSCRFELGCAEYTKLAIIKYGIVKGVYNGFSRLIRCQPFSNYSQNSKDFKNLN